MGQEEPAQRGQPSGPAYFLRELVVSAREGARDAPRWTRPLIAFGYFLGLTVFTLVLFVVFSPFMFLFRLFRRVRVGAFTQLHKELQTTWETVSPESALSKARELDDRLHEIVRSAVPEKVVPWVGWLWQLPKAFLAMRGPYIRPYGRFDFMEAGLLTWWVYESLMQLQHYPEAIALCDRELTGQADKRGRAQRHAEDWYVRKAKALRALYGRGQAIEYLLQYRDTTMPLQEIEAYLAELREDNGSDDSGDGPPRPA